MMEETTIIVAIILSVHVSIVLCAIAARVVAGHPAILPNDGSRILVANDLLASIACLTWITKSSFREPCVLFGILLAAYPSTAMAVHVYRFTTRFAAVRAAVYRTRACSTISGTDALVQRRLTILRFVVPAFVMAPPWGSFALLLAAGRFEGSGDTCRVEGGWPAAVAIAIPSIAVFAACAYMAHLVHVDRPFVGQMKTMLFISIPALIFFMITINVQSVHVAVARVVHPAVIVMVFSILHTILLSHVPFRRATVGYSSLALDAFGEEHGHALESTGSAAVRARAGAGAAAAAAAAAAAMSPAVRREERRYARNTPASQTSSATSTPVPLTDDDQDQEGGYVHDLPITRASMAERERERCGRLPSIQNLVKYTSRAPESERPPQPWTPERATGHAYYTRVIVRSPVDIHKHGVVYVPTYNSVEDVVASRRGLQLFSVFLSGKEVSDVLTLWIELRAIAYCHGHDMVMPTGVASTPGILRTEGLQDDRRGSAPAAESECAHPVKVCVRRMMAKRAAARLDEKWMNIKHENAALIACAGELRRFVSRFAVSATPYPDISLLEAALYRTLTDEYLPAFHRSTDFPVLLAETSGVQVGVPMAARPRRILFSAKASAVSREARSLGGGTRAVVTSSVFCKATAEAEAEAEEKTSESNTEASGIAPSQYLREMMDALPDVTTVTAMQSVAASRVGTPRKRQHSLPGITAEERIESQLTSSLACTPRIRRVASMGGIEDAAAMAAASATAHARYKDEGSNADASDDESMYAISEFMDTFEEGGHVADHKVQLCFTSDETERMQAATMYHEGTRVMHVVLPRSADPNESPVLGGPATMETSHGILNLQALMDRTAVGIVECRYVAVQQINHPRMQLQPTAREFRNSIGTDVHSVSAYRAPPVRRERRESIVSYLGPHAEESCSLSEVESKSSESIWIR